MDFHPYVSTTNPICFEITFFATFQPNFNTPLLLTHLLPSFFFSLPTTFHTFSIPFPPLSLQMQVRNLHFHPWCTYAASNLILLFSSELGLYGTLCIQLLVVIKWCKNLSLVVMTCTRHGVRLFVSHGVCFSLVFIVVFSKDYVANEEAKVNINIVR